MLRRFRQLLDREWLPSATTALATARPDFAPIQVPNPMPSASVPSPNQSKAAALRSELRQLTQTVAQMQKDFNSVVEQFVARKSVSLSVPAASSSQVPALPAPLQCENRPARPALLAHATDMLRAGTRKGTYRPGFADISAS